MLKNDYLINAKRKKADEFYTRYEDVENQALRYKNSFVDKIVYCPCDGGNSNFVKFLMNNYNNLSLSGLYYSGLEDGCYYYDGNETIRLGDGVDIRCDGFYEMLSKCDLVFTNPPFSLFVSFLNSLVVSGVDFIIVGNQNAISSKSVFEHIINDNVMPDYNFKGLAGYFYVPDDYEDFAASGVHKEGMIRVSGVMWYANIVCDVPKHEYVKLTEHFYLGDGTTNERYKYYDHFRDISGLDEDCINVDKVKDIPCDWDGYIGVPISFMTKYNKEQFEIIQLDHYGVLGNQDNMVDGKIKYRRIYIKVKK